MPMGNRVCASALCCHSAMSGTVQRYRDTNVSPWRRRSVFSDPLEPSVEEKHQRAPEQVKSENAQKKAMCIHLCARCSRNAISG